MKKEKVVLAYSGGLDTSVILKWLVNKGYDVICFIGDVGLNEDLEAVKMKAYQSGAAKVYLEDLQKEFVTDFIFPAMQGNALYEGRYLLGTALARPLLAKRQIEIAELENASYVAHGATGKGNDQVRFELSYFALNPEINVISPWKDAEFLNHFKGRSDLIAYAKQYHIHVKATIEKSYSEDENLMHISHEAGILEDPDFRPDESVYSRTKPFAEAPDSELVIEIHFQDGLPIKVYNTATGEAFIDSLEMFQYLNSIAENYSIGRVDMVENRFIGIKSRGVYETPGATILWMAHRDLEGLAMDKEVMHIRDMLIPKFSELIYNGFWFSPEMDFLMSSVRKSQEAIDGKVTMMIQKGCPMVIGRESPTSLYDPEISSMEVEGDYNPFDALGFININAIRLKAHALVLKDKNPYHWRTKGGINEVMGS